MSYITVKDNSRNRFNKNLQFLNYISSLEPTNPREIVPLEVNIMKGLFYVHLYSSLEKTVNELVQQTILLVNSKLISYKHYSYNFHTIALFNKLQSFKSCGHKNFFPKAYEIFDEISNSTNANLSETIFANNLQNVWFKTIEEVSLCFGVKGITTSAMTKATINEIVDKRNAVAHGRETASNIGERFRSDVLRMKFTEISNFSYELVDLYDDYFIKKDYLKPAAKRLYL